jgi:hypothetical protein
LRCFALLAAKAIHTAKGITRLHLLSPNYVPLVELLCLQNTRLPRLVDCVLPHSTHIYRFLHQNDTSKLESLQVSPSENIIDDLETIKQYPDLTFPRLEYFAGPASAIPVLVPRSAVKRMSILWFREDDKKATLSDLPKSITGLENMILDWREIPEIMAVLAETLPDLQTMRFSSMGIAFTANKEVRALRKAFQSILGYRKMI